MNDPRPRALHLELDAYPSDAVDRLRSAVDLEDGSALDSDDIVPALSRGEHQLLFVRLGISLTAAVKSSAPALKLIVTPTTGLDHLDVDGLRDVGIRVISLRDARSSIASVHATAEHTFALLLAAARRLPEANRDVAEGRWRRRMFLGTELAGRTLGIIGHGRLGSRVARYARAFDMRVLVHDTDPSRLTLLDEGVVPVDPDDLLAQSDFVTIHLPLDESTRGWLDERRTALLRDGAIVVNTSRGEIIDEHQLARHLASGRLGGVAVDVLADDSTWSEEVGASPLLSLHDRGFNLIVTPHIGGWARDAVARTRRLVTELALEAL
jgi:D-3-phosphoglycerate dehydrogenase